MMSSEELSCLFGRDFDTDGVLSELCNMYDELDTKTNKDVLTAEVLQDVFEVFENNLM